MSEIICREAEDTSELTECFAVRKKIFVDEQALFVESDRDDYDDSAIHLVALHDGKIIGTVRIYTDKEGTWWGGRLAVKKRYRGRAGKLLVRKAVETVKQNKSKHFRARVQKKNVAFFKGLGWQPAGPVFTHHGRPHQVMEADLS